MRTRSIRRKLTLVSLITTCTALFVAGALILAHHWFESRRLLLDRLATSATIVANNCTAPLVFGDAPAGREALESLRGTPGLQHAVLYDRSGAFFSEYRAPGTALPPGAPPVRAPMRAIERGAAVVFVPVLVDGEPIGTVYIRAGTGEIDARVARYAVINVLAALGSLAMALLLLSRLLRAATRPVLDLAQLMKTVAEKRDYRARATPRGGDEPATLAIAFNDMLDAIQQRDRELELRRRSLEEDVARRTAELAAANAQLKAELSERQRAERALEIAAQEWRATFDSIRDAVCVVDPAFRLVRTNSAFLLLVGSDAETVAGRPLGEVLEPVLGPEPSDLRDRAPSIRKAGNRWFELTGDPILGTAGEPVGWVQLISDVTERHTLQEQLGEAQKMEAVGQLAGGIAHDFNNLLSVILTFGKAIAAELPEGEEDLRASAAEIVRAGERAAALTRQLLAFSRKQVLCPEIFRVDHLIASFSRMIGRVIGENIELSIELAAGTGCAEMDPAQLEQALLNLAVNARDAMPSGGKLTIEARDVELGLDGAHHHPRLRPGGYVQIRFSDTGTGMEPHVLEHAFEPFFTTKPPGKGTGLGLAMVYGALQQSGGDVDVVSQPGVGTTFTLLLPRTEPCGGAAARVLPEA